VFAENDERERRPTIFVRERARGTRLHQDLDAFGMAIGNYLVQRRQGPSYGAARVSVAICPWTILIVFFKTAR